MEVLILSLRVLSLLILFFLVIRLYMAFAERVGEVIIFYVSSIFNWLKRQVCN